MQDGIDDAESEVVQDLLYIAAASQSVASSVVGLGWVQDGIDGTEAEAIAWINNIESAGVASSVVALGWVQDGVDDIEVEAIEEISYIAYEDAEVASSVVGLGWVQDGIDGTEAEAIAWINNIESAGVVSSVVALGWVQDGVDDVEVEAIENLSYIANEDAGVALSVVGLGWVQDGIEDAEAEAIEWMQNIHGTEVASSVVSLGWVQDGVDDIEVKAIEELSYIANEDADVALSVVSLGWVQDGVDRAEADLVDDFASIAVKDASAALWIVGMPFLETIEPPDVSAMASLRLLAAFDLASFQSVMSHPALRDGITNSLAPVVATLNGVAETTPGLLGVLLDPDRILLERRAITLPLSGEVVLYIVRTGSGAARSMELLERSVRGAEEYMGAPLPTNYIGLLYEDAVPGANAGTNFGTHIAVLPKYDVDDGSHEAQGAGSVIAHEVAHYYWSGNADWVDEGAADFMASIIEGARIGNPVGVTNNPCAHAANIAGLEMLGIARGDVEFGCNYSLGERLLVDLYRMLGDERFRQGFRDLYLASEVEDDADEYEGTRVAIEHVMEAFRSDDGAANTVTARWYDGTEPYDLSHLDTDPVDASLASINGRIDEAYIAASQDGPAVSAISAQDATGWVYLILKYSYSVSGQPREVPLEIVEHYEDGFEFDRRSDTLTARAQYIGGTSWYPVGSAPTQEWATGHYVVYVYAGERKVAEAEYEVTP